VYPDIYVTRRLRGSLCPFTTDVWTRAILAFPSNPLHRDILESVYNCLNYEIIFTYPKRTFTLQHWDLTLLRPERN